ncbi:major facilitator superfamily domain-containing protein [Cladochytrium replicatum]|nr:major facilitator superfamily domain-containing protein [Cladochytrium replicatum]
MAPVSWQPHLVAIVALACLSMTTAGTVYMFSLYGPELARHLHLSAVQTSIVITCGTYGLYLSGPAIGWAIDGRMCENGPRPVLLSASAALFFGYLSVALAYSSNATSPVFWLSASYFVVGFGCCAASQGSMAWVVKNVGEEARGVAVGVAASFFGISAALHAQIARAFFTGTGDGEEGRKLDVQTLLVFLAVSGGIANVVSATLQTKDRLGMSARKTSVADLNGDAEEDEESRDVVGGSMQAQVHRRVAKKNYVAVSSLEQDEATTSSRTDTERTQLNGSRGSGEEEDIEDSLVDIEEVDNHSTPDVSCYGQVDAVYLGVAIVCITGVGLMVINNVGTVVVALSGSETAQSSMVTLLSLGNFLGRLIIGYVSDVAWRSFKLRRLVWLGLSAAIMVSVGLFGSLVVSGIGHLSILVVAAGIAYGMFWTIGPLVTSEFFGIKNFAMNWGSLSVLPSLGSQLSNLVFGLLVDAARSRSEGSNDGSTICRGRQCFVGAFSFAGVLGLIGVIAVLALYRRKYGSVLIAN